LSESTDGDEHSCGHDDAASVAAVAGASGQWPTYRGCPEGDADGEADDQRPAMQTLGDPRR
jgi:hypothetical protein